MTIEKVQEIIQDKQVDAQEAKDLNDIIRSNVIDSKLSETINKNITPDLIKGILSGIENTTKDQNSIDSVYIDLLKGLRLYSGDNADIKNRINKLEIQINNLPNLEKRKELENNIKTPLANMMDLNSKLLTAYFIIDVATTPQTQQTALVALTQLFPDSPSDFKNIKSFLEKKQEKISVFQKEISVASKLFQIFDKENPVLSVEKTGGFVSGLRGYIGNQLTAIDVSSVFNSSLKGIKTSRLKDFLEFQQSVIKKLPDDQVVPYIKSLEVKINELKNNKNLTPDDVKNLENVFTGIFEKINTYTNQNNIEVPQISKKEYLTKAFHMGLFSQSEYKSAFEECFDEKNDVLSKNAIQATELSISKSFEEQTLKQIVFTPYFVTIGKEIDPLLKDDPELASYPVGTKILVVVPMDKSNSTNELKFKREENKLVQATEGLIQEHRTYIVFGEDSIFSNLKAEKFGDSYQRIDEKDKLNGQDFDVIKSDGTIDLQQFDSRGEKAFSIWISNQSNDIFEKEPGFENFFKALNEYENKKDSNKTVEYQKGFYTATVTEIIKRAPSNNKLFENYINLVSKDLNLSYLGKDPLSQKNNHLLLQKFITDNKRLESSDQAQKDMAIKIGSLGLLFQEKTEPKTFQNTINEYAKLLFSHPIGKMIFGLIDSFFGGKGGFLDKISKRDKSGKLAESVNEQFKKQYELNSGQLTVINELNKDKMFDETAQENLVFNKHDKLAQLLKDKGDLLDANVLKSFIKDGKLVLIDNDVEVEKEISDIFSLNEKGEYAIKSTIDTNVLALILKQKSIEKAILATDVLLKGQTDKTYYGKAGEERGIKTESDYAMFLTAYLMGGSKGDAKFHYVISENNIGSKWLKEEKVAEKQEEAPEEKIFSEKENKIRNEIKTKINDGKYDGKYTISTYSYDASDAAEQTPYQDNILKPMKELFDNTKAEGAKKSNFELLLTSFDNSESLSKDAKDDLIHIKNMLIYMNEGKTTEQAISQDVIDNILTMSKEKSESGKLVFSDDAGNEIDLSYVGDKLQATYVPVKSGQVAAAQESQGAEK